MPKAAKTRTERPTSSRTTVAVPNRTSSAPVSGAGREYKFNFGQHRGKTLYQVPADYVQWCIRANVAEEREDPKFIAAIKKNQEKYPSAQQRMKAVQEKVPAWLFNACNKAFDATYDDDFQAFWSNTDMQRHELEKVEALEKMAKLLAPSYPPRPTDDISLPESESVKDLRTVLSLLPEGARGMTELYNTEAPDETNSVYMHWDGFTGNYYPSLTERRHTEIQRALEAVEKAHGVQVRALADWEVYDKVLRF